MRANPKGAIIKKDTYTKKQIEPYSSEPGQYGNPYKPMGADLGNVDFGNKYSFKPKAGPAPG